MSHASRTLQGLHETAGPAAVERRPGVMVLGAGKGGVGTSSVAVLLARIISHMGRRVLLVDGDESMGNLHLLLGIGEPGPGIGALRRPGMEPTDLVVSLDGGPDLLSGGGGELLGTIATGIGERRILFRRLGELYERYDTVLVDGGSRVESVLAAVGAGMEQLVVVTTPDPISLAGSFALIKLVQTRFSEPRMALLLNGGTRKGREVALDHLTEALDLFGRDPIPVLPHLPALEAAEGSDRPSPARGGPVRDGVEPGGTGDLPPDIAGLELSPDARNQLDRLARVLLDPVQQEGGTPVIPLTSDD